MFHNSTWYFSYIPGICCVRMCDRYTMIQRKYVETYKNEESNRFENVARVSWNAISYWMYASRWTIHWNIRLGYGWWRTTTEFFICRNTQLRLQTTMHAHSSPISIGQRKIGIGLVQLLWAPNASNLKISIFNSGIGSVRDLQSLLRPHSDNCRGENSDDTLHSIAVVEQSQGNLSSFLWI